MIRSPIKILTPSTVGIGGDVYTECVGTTIPVQYFEVGGRPRVVTRYTPETIAVITPVDQSPFKSQRGHQVVERQSSAPIVLSRPLTPIRYSTRIIQRERNRPRLTITSNGKVILIASPLGAWVRARAPLSRMVVMNSPPPTNSIALTNSTGSAGLGARLMATQSAIISASLGHPHFLLEGGKSRTPTLSSLQFGKSLHSQL